MNIEFLTIIVIISILIGICMIKLIQDNTKTVSFQNGMFPQKTGLETAK